MSLSSLNDEASYDRAKAYGQSKLANVLFAQELAERLALQKILVNAVHPGGVDTELSRHIEDAIASVVGSDAKAWLKNNIFPSADTGAMWHPRDASLTQLYAAISPEVKSQRITGKYYHPIARLTVPDPHTFNKTLQRGLWELTEAFIASH